MSAAHYKLDNVSAFLDFNGLQIDGNVNEVMGVDQLILNGKLLVGML